MVSSRNSGRDSAKRQANMELLRCVAMMMIVVLHYLGKSGLLADPTEKDWTAVGTAAWVLESFCITAVNLYMLLSGYFGWKSPFKLSRLIRIWLQIWFYSAIVGLAAFAVWGYPKDSSGLYFFLKLFFPVSMEHYWFMTAYVFLYLFLPFAGAALRKMDQKQMKSVLMILLFVFCLLKTVVPVRFETDRQGYDSVWYLCLYTAGAYISRFKRCGSGEEQKARKKKGWFMYLAGAACIFGELYFLHRVYLSTGKLATIGRISMDYNHLFPLITSIGLFLVFESSQFNSKISYVIIKISPYTLGVYLLHENMVLRYLWQNWLGASRVDSVPSLVAWTICAVAAVFTVGVVLDWFRTRIFQQIHRLLLKLSPYRTLLQKVEAVDAMFRDSLKNI